jgi:hypothetical protein
MIFKKNILGIDDPFEEYIREKFRESLTKGNLSIRQFRNDFYKIVQDTLFTIRNYLSNQWDGFFPEQIRTPDELNTYFTNLKNLNALNNLRMTKIRDYIGALADHTEKAADVLNKQIGELKPLISAVESNLINNTTDSIRNEYYPSVEFDSGDSIQYLNGTLNGDEGCITVPLIETNTIRYLPMNENLFEINGNPLKIREGDNNSLSTSKLFTSGFYYGKLFDVNPIFKDTPDISNIEIEDDMNFYVESYEEKALEVTMRFVFVEEAPSIGTMNIMLGKCSDIVQIKDILIKKIDEPSFVSIKDRVTSPGIIYRGIQPQVPNFTAKTNVASQYPRIHLTINESEIQELKIILSVNNSESTEYIEYKVVDPEERILNILNYFESLVYTNFNFPSTFPVTKTGIRSDSLERLVRAGRVIPETKSINKRYLNVNAVNFKGIQKGSRAEYVSLPVGRGNEIASIEILTNEVIPAQLTRDAIRYSITTDDVIFTEIHPLNALNPDGKSTRIVIDPRDTARVNMPAAGSVKVKIVIDDQGTSHIPKVYGYVLRIKETFGL